MNRYPTRRFLLVAWVFVLLVLLSSLSMGQENAPAISRYGLGHSEYDRQLEMAKSTIADDTELGGWKTGYNAEMEKIQLVITIFKNGTVEVSMYGQDLEPMKFEMDDLTIKVFNADSEQYIPLGTFSKDRKKLVMTNGTILDKSPG